eukprot:6191323-Pleurochrysis_carterae.AAC.1
MRGSSASAPFAAAERGGACAVCKRCCARLRLACSGSALPSSPAPAQCNTRAVDINAGSAPLFAHCPLSLRRRLHTRPFRARVLRV